jgi:hypothetical protein
MINGIELQSGKIMEGADLHRSQKFPIISGASLIRPDDRRKIDVHGMLIVLLIGIPHRINECEAIEIRIAIMTTTLKFVPNGIIGIWTLLGLMHKNNFKGLFAIIARIKAKSAQRVLASLNPLQVSLREPRTPMLTIC